MPASEILVATTFIARVRGTGFSAATKTLPSVAIVDTTTMILVFGRIVMMIEPERIMTLDTHKNAVVDEKSSSTNHSRRQDQSAPSFAAILVTPDTEGKTANEDANNKSVLCFVSFVTRMCPSHVVITKLTAGLTG